MRCGGGSYIGVAVHVAISAELKALSGPERLYLDHAATTPVVPEARAAMVDALERWANPSSPHTEGRKARAALEEARRTIAHALGWRHDVILTSGASEAIQLAAQRAKVPGRLFGATEHDAVIAAMGAGAEMLPVEPDGLIDLDFLEGPLAHGPALVAVQHVNNETGVIQPLDRIHALASASGSLLLADCAQSAGKLPPPDADFIAISGHKLGGPPGIGALLVKDLATLDAAGGQERGYRRGTENLPAAAGLAAALEGAAFGEVMSRLAELRRQLEDALTAGGGLVMAAEAPRVATIGAYALPGAASASQLVQFDLAGIAVSAGSACSSGTMKPSRVLAAMGIAPEIAGCVIRVSFGPATSEADIARFLGEWRRIRERGRAEAA